MTKGDIITICLGTFLVEGEFISWIDEDTIQYEIAGDKFTTHYKSVVEINGQSV